jgi:hypothetical protein
MVTWANNYTVFFVKHYLMSVNPHRKGRLYMLTPAIMDSIPEANTLVTITGNTWDYLNNDLDWRCCWSWCCCWCRMPTHFRCKGNMVDRVPQIEEDASPAVGKSAMMVFAADRAAAGLTVNVPA